MSGLAAGSWVRDSFGERAVAVDADGRPVEFRRLPPQFTVLEPALSAAIARLRDFDRPSIARMLRLELDVQTGCLVLVSEHTPGVRLSELLKSAVEQSAVAEVGAALFVMRRLLSTLESLHAVTGLPQFGIAPECIVITPGSRVVLAEPALGTATVFSTTTTDVAGVALVGMAMMLGRTIEAAENIDPLSPLLQDVAEVAAIRAGDAFSTALRLWFDRAIINEPGLAFADFRRARLALERIKLPPASGCVVSRRTLKVFLTELAIDSLGDAEGAAIEANRVLAARARRVARHRAIAATDDEWISVGDEVAQTADEQPEKVAERQQDSAEPVEVQEVVPFEFAAEDAVTEEDETIPTEAAPDEEEPVASEEPSAELTESAVPTERPPLEAAATDAEKPLTETLDEMASDDATMKSPGTIIADAPEEDSHREWIRAITTQLGLGREQEDEDTVRPPTQATTDDATEPAEEPVTAADAELPGSATEQSPAERPPVFAAAIPPPNTSPVPQPEAATPAAPPASWLPKRPVPLPDDDDLAVPIGAFDEDPALHSSADLRTARAARPISVNKPRKIVVASRDWKRPLAAVLMVVVGAGVLVGLGFVARASYIRATTPGTVAVDSAPQGSEVWVDGVAGGRTPVTLTLKPGEHLLELRQSGVTHQFAINVAPGAALSQRLDWSTVKAVGKLTVTSTPAGAKVLVDGNERGITPLTLSDVAAGTHTVVLESSGGSVRRQVKVAAGAETELAEAIISGWIAVFAPFELQILESNRPIGTTEDDRIMLPPGQHQLELVNVRLGYRERRAIDVSPGETTAINITAPTGIVRVEAAPGADVWIDGTFFGETPLRELNLPIGTHEILVRHPRLGERRVTVTVTLSAPAEVNLNLGR